MSLSLDGQVAIVTGAGRGIGRAIARALCAEGATVAVASRTLSEVTETVELIRQDGGQAIAILADVADHASVTTLVDRVTKLRNRIDILVNNAGIQGPIGPLVSNDWRAWQSSIEVNLIGAFFCCQAVLPIMIEQKSGRIINLSGGGATAPRPNFSAYSAAKAAIVRLTETLAQEVREHNVQVNAVAPGAVNTRMLQEVLQAGTAAGSEQEAAQKRDRDGGTPPELAAELVTFLASQAPKELTGKLIAAAHDAWAAWDEETLAILAASPWLTLRRVDPFTISAVAPDGVDRDLAHSLQK